MLYSFFPNRLYYVIYLLNFIEFLSMVFCWVLCLRLFIGFCQHFYLYCSYFHYKIVVCLLTLFHEFIYLEKPIIYIFQLICCTFGIIHLVLIIFHTKDYRNCIHKFCFCFYKIIFSSKKINGLVVCFVLFRQTLFFLSMEYAKLFTWWVLYGV